MFCENCGNRISDATRFCGSCGTAVSPPVAATPATAPIRSVPVVPPQPVIAPPPALPAGGQYAPQPPPFPPGAYSATPQAEGAQYPPPLPGAAPAYQAPPPKSGIVQSASPVATPVPMPPNMHWAIVFILSAFTYGLGALVWAIKEAIFVKKLDPNSKGVLFLGLASAVIVVQAVLQIMNMRASSVSEAQMFVVIIAVLNLIIAALSLIGIFGMRRSLVNYYNNVEPIGLQLGGAMTFFFNVFYFQYHFSRIAAWKKGGTLK